MIEFLWALGCILGYLMAGAGTARIYYVRATDAEAARRGRVTGERGEGYYRLMVEPDDPEFKSVIVLAFWWLVIPGYFVFRSYRATILAPTPRQRERAEEEQRAQGLRELHRMSNDVARWQPPKSPDYDAATVFLNDPEFKSATRSFLDGDELHP